MMRTLSTAAEAQEWVARGGDIDDAARFGDVLRALIPDLEFGPFATRPCITVMSETGRPYIGHTSDRVIVAVEGDHGLTIGDEIGRLVTRLAVDGEWRDSLPADQFTPRYA
jgi:glycine/D-amino acid oxidase-like deaminating enzyme